jgi:hypothetical protein
MGWAGPNRRGLDLLHATAKMLSSRWFAAALRWPARSFSSSPSARKIYELRIYAVQPVRMKECMGVLEKDVLPLRSSFSKLNGCWYTELGALNEINFLWEYGKLCNR